MTLLSFARRLAARAAILVVVVGGSGSAMAADVTPAPAAIAAPALPGPSCAACNGGAPADTGCATCGRGLARFGSHLHLGGKKKAPYVVELCPGACFGYFQTQWHKWEDVCPLPYQGVGQSDAPRPSPGYVAPLSQPNVLPDVRTPGAKPGTPEKKPDGRGSDAPAPRPIGPMPPNAGAGLPSIPNLPTTAR